MGQVLGLDNIPQLAVASTTSLTLAATNNGLATRLTIGGQQYSLSSALAINTGTVGINGMDTGSLAANTLYYVYAVVSSNVVGMVISLSATAPTGFAQYANIGRVRTLFGSAGLAQAANWLNGLLQSPSAAALGDIGITATGFGTTQPKYDCTRVSNCLLVDFFFVTASIQASTASINFPSFAIDYSKLSNQGNGQIVGSHTSADPLSSSLTTGSGNRTGIVFTDGNTARSVFLTVGTASAIFTKVNGSAGWNVNASMTGQFKVQIAEWAGLYS